MTTAYKILIFMKRKPGTTMEQFMDYYENRHVPLCLKYSSAVSRYIRRFLTPMPHAESGTNEELPYDVVTELWFDEEATFKGTVEYLSTHVMPEEVVQDEINVFHRPTMRMATVIECETAMLPSA